MPETFFSKCLVIVFIFKSEAGQVRWQIGSEPASHEDSSIRGGSPCSGGKAVRTARWARHILCAVAGRESQRGRASEKKGFLPES